MADINDQMQSTAQQGAQSAQNAASHIANTAAKPAKRIVKKVGQRAANRAWKTAHRVGKAAAKLSVKAIKGAMSLIGKLLAILGPVGIAVILAIIFFGATFSFVLNERGSNESNNLDPEYQNPSYLESESGITKAIAMTEPQAVSDAYYKFISCSSYIKTFADKQLEFNDPEESQDFAALRDYNKIEENFYLSDDFLRSMDEMLHHDEFYYPEQVIKPVYGQKMSLKDKAGHESKTYTSRLPFDTPAGEQMLNTEIVKNFSAMLVDGYTLSDSNAVGDIRQLLPHSQKPQAVIESDGTVSEQYYKLADRNVMDASDTTDTEKGLWDYGFASVLEYQAEEKQSYIECTYDKVDVDYDYELYEIIDYDKNGDPIYDWTGPYHGFIQSINITGTADDLKAVCSSQCTSMTTDTKRWSVNYPENLEAIVNDSTAWNMAKEGNSAAEAAYNSFYNRSVTNSHIDAKITNSWDSDIDHLAFDDPALKVAYGNVGGGLYPINIAIVSHAATFSGNIHYTIIPAGENGCNVEEEALSPNSEASIDHRLPVQTILVAGGCSSAALTAHRTGTLFTKTPAIEETTSPWGFEYLEQYAAYYRCYAPKDYINDREFMVRTGLNAAEGSDAEKQYLRNLDYLMSLGLLRLYSGNISYSATGSVDLSSLSDSESDLYILSHVIAAEAGPNKLDELMVGSVFVNRVQSGLFPNTFKEVLTQGDGGQYACWADGNYQNAKPTDREIASAIQVLTGQFSIPDNILGQSASVQGNIYITVNNGPGYNTHYYCAMPAGTAISTVDRYGRPAVTGSDTLTQLTALASTLKGDTSFQAGAAAASIDYSGTAFIGDDLTAGLDTSQSLSTKGASVITSTTASLTQLANKIDASDSLGMGIKTVYLLAGTYCSTINDSEFRTQYLSLLQSIQAKAPSAQIIVTSLPPVVDSKSATSNSYISGKNAIIQDIATSQNYKILDINTPLSENGQLRSEYSGDGTCLSAAGYDVWFSKIQSGLTSSNIGTDVTSAFSLIDQSGIPIYSRYTLYDISEFDVLAATNMQARVVQAETGIVATLKTLLNNAVDFATSTAEGIREFIGKFFSATSDAILGESKNRKDIYYYYSAPYNNYDVRSTIYHTIAFSTQTLFSTAESVANEKAEAQDLTFLFVGKMSSLGLGSLTSSKFTKIPGTGTAVEGMISPTTSYVSPLTPYSPAAGFTELSTAAGTSVLAVADGIVTDIGTDPSDAKGKYVTQESVIDGITYTITYGYLDSISVGRGGEVSSGSQIGTSGTRSDGTAAMYLSVKKDGVYVDPNTIFYQSTYSFGGTSLGQNLYNDDSSVNEASIKELHTKLMSMVDSHNEDEYHRPPMNNLERLQCTWWAYGRGLNYLISSGSSVSVTDYNKIRGNGGQYAANNAAAGIFNYGSTPKPNALACYPGTPGHITYVEAVDYVNGYYYISHAGSGKAFYGIAKRKFDYVSSYGTKATFIYLDEPLV